MTERYVSPLQEARDCLVWAQQHPDDAAEQIGKALTLIDLYPHVLNRQLTAGELQNSEWATDPRTRGRVDPQQAVGYGRAGPVLQDRVSPSSGSASAEPEK